MSKPKPHHRPRPVYIDAGKHRALKRYAKAEKTFLSAVVDEAIESYIKRKRIPMEASPVA